MFAIAIVVFCTGLVSLISLFAIGGPMVRASELQYGLAAGRDKVKQMRGERGTLRSQLADLESAKQAESKALDEMRAQLKDLNDKIGRLPKHTQQLTFELGVADAGMTAFDFVLSRQSHVLDAEKVSGPERSLWKQPRVLRVWARTQATAEAVAEKRYPIQAGFIVRAAERIGPAGAARR
jgi:hypothetical protein